VKKILVKEAEKLNRCLSCFGLYKEDDEEGPTCPKCRAQLGVKELTHEEQHQNPSQ